MGPAWSPGRVFDSPLRGGLAAKRRRRDTGREMSEENVAVVKKFVPPVGTDFTQLFGNDGVWAATKDAVSPLVASELEFAFIAWGQRLEYRGLDGMREGWRDWLVPWTSYYDEIEAIFAADDDRVVVIGREHGYRRDTSAGVEAEVTGVYTLRDGKIVRIEAYANRAEAMEAVGLRTPPPGGENPEPRA
jgi:SnoaL-like domain